MPAEEWPEELLFCVFTPQSDPYRVDRAMAKLRSLGVLDKEVDADVVASVLGDPAHYVRFHKVKAERVEAFRRRLPEIRRLLGSGLSPQDERRELVRIVAGFGWKEASHALRNIGRRGLAILDRHVLRNLVRCRVIESVPVTLGAKRYVAVEQAFAAAARAGGLDMDELDLFFWGRETGSVFK